MQAINRYYTPPLINPDEVVSKVVYTPDFERDNLLYADGELNDVSVMQNKPKYRAVIASTQRVIDVPPSPDLPDNVLAETCVSRDMDVNELCSMIDSDMRQVLYGDDD